MWHTEPRSLIVVSLILSAKEIDESGDATYVWSKRGILT